MPVKQLCANPKSKFQIPKSLPRRFNPAHLRAHAAASACRFINDRPVINKADGRNRAQVHTSPAARAFFFLYFHTTLILRPQQAPAQ